MFERMRALLFLLAACTPQTDAPVDRDHDGFSAAVDCNDDDADVNTSEQERCNGVDDNCDGLVDDRSAVDAPDDFEDIDGDGYGGLDGAVIPACNLLPGYAYYGGDCDDH